MGVITAEANVKNSLQKAGLIPEIIEDTISASTLLQIDYGQTDVALGNNVSPDQAKHQPSVFFIGEEESYYTLIMTDPDAPSTEDKSFGPWRHWVVVNIAGSDIGTITKPENQHTPYIGPGPGENTGTHRYVFLLYRQKKGQHDFKPMEHEQRQHRRSFNIREFETENHLELVTANFFCCPT